MSRAAGIFLAALATAVATRGGTREVYVWQRQAGAEVTAALREFAPQVDGFCALAAEVSWPAGRLRVVRPSVDFAALAALRKPAGLALRLGAFAGPFARDDATARALVALAAELIAQARAAGLEPSELQVDFDAAEAKLDGYRAWLAALRGATAPGRVRLVFTALPSWLHRAEFAPLARAADAFVLQVHSLEKPSVAGAPFALCDPARALAWARQAGGVGVPFRIALPTYGYVVAFTPEGKFLGLAAEGPRPAWPAGTRAQLVRADAPALARLAQALADAPPPHCTGVIWFRLPIAGDRLNWDAVTFATVLRGDVPRALLRVEAAAAPDGLVEIVAVNAGATTEPPPPRIALRWPPGERLLAGDGLGGFRLDAEGAEGQATIVANAVPPDALLAPGGRVKIAWLRFAHELPVDASLPASLPPP